MHIKIIQQWTPTHQRENDILIMEQLPEGYSKEIHISINASRVFLHANTLADITHFLGDKIAKEAWAIQKPKRVSTSAWPQQYKPGYKCVERWQTALKNTR